MSPVTLIIFPVIFMVLLTFIFSTSVNGIKGQQFYINCPLPIYEGVATNVIIDGVLVNYNITHNKDINGNTTSNNEAKVGTRFECQSTGGGLLSVNTSTHQYGATLFSTIPYGWFGFISHSITDLFQKIWATIYMIYLFMDAPVQLTGQAFFTLIYAMLIFMISLGVFLIIRGSN